MLAKKYRLQKGRDFEMVFKKGRNVNGEFLFLKFRNNNLQVSRFGFILSKKISKKATIRNTIKRRLREIIRKEFNNIKPGFDVVIGTKAGVVYKSYQEIKDELERLMKFIRS